MKVRILSAALFSVLTAVAPGLLYAQGAFPTKPIQILIGYAPGGSTDVLVRTLAQESKKILGQDVIVVNKTGSAGSVAALQVTAAKPDGYILGVAPNGVTSGTYDTTLDGLLGAAGVKGRRGRHTRQRRCADARPERKGRGTAGSGWVDQGGNGSPSSLSSRARFRRQPLSRHSP